MISLILALLAATPPAIGISGDEACPTAREVTARLSELVPPDSPVMKSLNVHLFRRGDRLEIEISDLKGVELIDRSVPHRGSCAELARAVALVVASWAGEIGGPPADPSPAGIVAADNPAPASRPAPPARVDLMPSEPMLPPRASQDPAFLPNQTAEGLPPGRIQRAVGAIVGGVGIASLVVGAIYGLAAESNDRAAENACLMSSCGVAATAQIARATSDARRSDVFLGLGAGLVASGAIVYLLAPTAAESERGPRVRLAPAASVGSAGLVATVRF
jgi:hypothetical protein